MRRSLSLRALAPSAHAAGIVGMTSYFPRTVVSQTLLERADGVGEGKYRKGLEQVGHCGANRTLHGLEIASLALFFFFFVFFFVFPSVSL